MEHDGTMISCGTPTVYSLCPTTIIDRSLEFLGPHKHELPRQVTSGGSAAVLMVKLREDIFMTIYIQREGICDSK